VVADVGAGPREQRANGFELRGLGLVGAGGAAVSELLRAVPGWAAKRGAEGLFCARSPDGAGFVFKVEDGSTRALRPAIGHVLGLEAFRTVDIRNTRGDVVGSIR
jgi:L-asparaginase II